MPPKRPPAHYLWAVLIARIYEVLPLLHPMCGGQMRLIAFITEVELIRKILDHIGVDFQAPRAGHRCGMPVMRGWAKASKSSRTGIWRCNRPPITRSISTSTGDRAKRRFRRAAGAGLRARKAVNHWATKGIANHVVQRLKFRKSGSVLALPTRAILWILCVMRLNFLSVRWSAHWAVA